MNKLIFIFIIILIQSSFSRKNRTKYFEDMVADSIDYCAELENLANIVRYESHSHDKDSLRAWMISLMNCFYLKKQEHNKDSLTTNMDVCIKRLSHFLMMDYDSANISISNKDSNNIHEVMISPKDPNVLDGLKEFYINDSCRVLDYKEK